MKNVESMIAQKLALKNAMTGIFCMNVQKLNAQINASSVTESVFLEVIFIQC
jgi:hypothetical protein